MAAARHRPAASGLPRRPPAWAMVVLPVTLSLALLRLLLRSLARTVLALPGDRHAPKRFVRVLLWTNGVALATWILLFGDLSWRDRVAVLDWYWRQARVVGYPRLLDDFWARQLAAYDPDVWHSLLRPFVTLTTVWASAIFLGCLVLSAIRRGFRADGASGRLLPTPRPRAPLPVGFAANVLAVALWGWLPAGFVLALPPVVTLRGRGFSSTEAFTHLWQQLRWLSYPRLFDAHAARLIEEAEAHARDWRGAALIPLSAKFNRPLVVLVWLELLAAGFGVALVLAVVWLGVSWRRAAAGGGALDFPAEGGGPRVAPRWTLILLPITFPLALVGLAFWKSPLWLPRLVLRTVLLYGAGVVVVFAAVAYLHHERDPATPLHAVQMLRDDWQELDAHLGYVHWFDRWWDAIPHTRRAPPTELDGWRALGLLAAVVALAVPPLTAVVGTVLTLLKRTLEALAR